MRLPMYRGLLAIRAVLAKRLRLPIGAGLTTALDALDTEVTLHRRHQRGRQKMLADLRGSRELSLHFGCGPNLKPGWVNIDLTASADYTLDLREPLPLPDGSCRMIYHEHVLEHFDYPGQAMRLLRECRRLLQPGGELSVGVPDGELALLAYAGDDPQAFFATSKARWHPEWACTRMEQINYMFRQDGEHRFIYDWETLEKTLREAGFANVRRRDYDPALDSPERAWGTLYVSAERP